MAAGSEATAVAPPPGPEFRRRRELGAASARSLLLTVLGEFVLPAGRPVWTAAFLRGLGLVGVEEKAVRQALARSAGEGWIAGERHGRRTAWALTPAGEHLLTNGTERIYGFGRPPADWHGEWLMILASVPESDRRLRHLLRTRLAWNGLGNLSPGVWVSPHPEREPHVREVLAEIGVAETATLFTGRVRDLDEARRVARQAWDLGEITAAYEDFLAAAERLRPKDDAKTFAALTRLVQEWRRFPFLDPALPAELLPDDWTGWRAHELFHARHDTWRPGAERFWTTLTTE